MFPSSEDRLFWFLVQTARNLCSPTVIGDRTYSPAFKPGDIELTLYLMGVKWGYEVHRLGLA